MKTTTAIALLFLASTVAFVAGMNYGVSEGVHNYALLEQVAAGAVSRHQLAAIEKGKLEFITRSLELDIDVAIDRYAQYRADGNKYLSEYYFPFYIDNLERYIDLLAEYRKTHPVVFNADWAVPEGNDDAKVKEFKAQGHAESQEMLERIYAVLRARGISEPALTSQPSPTR